MAMMMTGKIRSRSNVLSMIGKTNAATMSRAGSPYFLSRATPLLPAPLREERHKPQVRETRKPDHDFQPKRQQDKDGDDDAGKNQIRVERAVNDRKNDRRHYEQSREPVLPQQGHAATPRPPAPPSGP